MDAFVRYPDPALQRAAVSRPVDAALLAVGDRLLAAAKAVQAYGLAAAHNGEVEPVIVISVAANSTIRDYRVMFNPGVVDVAPTMQTGVEGSVSLPGVEVAVDRPVWAEIGYDDAAGQRQTHRLAGFPARVALHEIDQMNGIFFLQRVSRLKRDAALRKFAKLDRGRG